MNYLDDEFSQYAEAFLGNMIGEGDIAFRSVLNSNVLNYSIESLHEVNHYLKLLHKKAKEIANIEYQNTVVWCGAYIGEVIRRNANLAYHWVQYEEYMKDKDQRFRNLLPYTLGTHALLITADASYVTLPINKVVRFLEEGEENNIHFYAGADISKTNAGQEQSVTKNPQRQRKPWWKF